MPELWVPFATKSPVELRPSQRKINPVGLVCHTAVSNAVVLRPTGTVRWHFYLAKDGKLTQFFPLNVSSACQRDGNYWTRDGRPYGFLSCESWDGAGTSVWPDYQTNHSGGPAWTEAQMVTWGKLGGWLGHEWGIFLGKATAAQGKGIGQHSDFTGSGDQIRWNTSHACVGTRRKAQMPSIRARMAAEAKRLDLQPEPGEDDMDQATFTKYFLGALQNEEVLDKIGDAVLERKYAEYPPGTGTDGDREVFPVSHFIARADASARMAAGERSDPEDPPQ